jgi:hypothetical protein
LRIFSYADDPEGPDFGTMLEASEPIFARVGRFTRNTKHATQTSLMCDTGTSKGGLGAKANRFITCASDEEVITGLVENAGDFDLSFGRLNELAIAQGCR